ncbi:uncharacterized protein LOC116698919 isoform X3 [Etheostoma spectabile]|uniref:uncharacterized protein LOC116698919 isoform X3 n=1 Tax=Etheostoma spectabile TaxID=54343 RepID=UPI0013AF9C35|nr:uncharacterized protein LOC116698919 isoform X3 [Etheostoma spectabile]
MAFRLPGGIPEEHLPDFPRGRIHGLHMQGRVDNFPHPAEPGLPEEEGVYSGPDEKDGRPQDWDDYKSSKRAVVAFLSHGQGRIPLGFWHSSGS